MSSNCRWYAEPEAFIAVAALIVSVSAVGVGLYKASLQRHHDRAEVWPHTEIQTLIKPTGAEITLENTGIGPAIIRSVAVTVDGQPQSNWREVLRALNGVEPGEFGNRSIARLLRVRLRRALFRGVEEPRWTDHLARRRALSSSDGRRRLLAQKLAPA